MTDPHPLELLEKTITLLGPLADEMVFVGGTVATALITDEAVLEFRPTDDVDAIVDVERLSQYYSIQQKLEKRGFSPDPEGPICRFVCRDLKIDVMPTLKEVLGFSNRFYPEAFKQAQEMTLPGGAKAKIATAPYFIAMKLDAFFSRGGGDYWSSHDLEDVISIIDGREEIEEECQLIESDTLSTYLKEKMDYLLNNDAFLEALPDHLPGDPASQERYSIILERMSNIRDSKTEKLEL